MSVVPTMFPRADAIAATKKKRVLLIDTSRVQRDLRSETMRRLGVEVDCAADITEARCWWRPQLYDLVLLHVEGAVAAVETFCNDMRSATPAQSLMFLVGRPVYLAASPQFEQPCVGEEETQPTSSRAAAFYRDIDKGLPRFGILEACRRISAIRSVCDARTRALRDRPEPPRDSEIRSKPVLDAETIESIREELP